MQEPETLNAPDPKPDESGRDDPSEPRPPRWLWIIDRNPMFLISGVCMLAGCFLVSRHIHEIDPSEVGGGAVVRLLIGLLVVLNVYEFTVIGLGLVLAKTRTLVRDARHLLGLALLLLVDASFVYTESGIADPRVGLAIVTMATLLAWFKAWLVLRSLRVRMGLAAQGVLAVSLAAMYALPIAVRQMANDGFLSQPGAMAVWCGLGVVLALHALPLRWMRIGASNSPDHRQLQRLVGWGLIGLPLISLIGHAGAALWVYGNGFEPAMMSPILLGLAAVLLRHHRALGGGRPTAQAATLVVASAVVAALMPGDGLIYASEYYTWLAFSPLRGVLITAPLLLGWGWWIAGRRPAGLINTSLPLCASALGHTPSAMLGHLNWLVRELIELLPTTKLQWGATAITAAFTCLLLGGLLSWWRRAAECGEASAGGG